MKPEKQTSLKLCLTVLLLLAALFEIWRIWGAQHKPIDTADNGQMTAPLLPLQNPTLISGEHGYRSNKEEISEPFAVTSKSKETEERWDEEIPWFIKGCKGLETESKPVIYLYPESETEVTVRLEYKGRLTCTYPAPDPDGAWRVTARPDGTLTDKQGREYSYLFWEGESNETLPDFSRGFVVRGADTAAFLREKLAYMGLTPREYNEFIVYWLPRMQDNPWNLIAFQGKNYTDSAPLAVTPRPDSVLRVFMAYRPMAAPVVVPPQELTPFVRKGFTLVEWGGQGPDGAVR